MTFLLCNPFWCKLLIDTFCPIARYKGEDRVLQFTMVTSWDSILCEICERWGLEVSSVRVKIVTPDAHRTICPIDSDVDFQRMCHIHHMFNSGIVNLIVDTVKGVKDVPLCSSLPL